MPQPKAPRLSLRPWLKETVMRLVGKQTTEGTTTSLTTVALNAVSSISIPAAAPILAVFLWARTTGAATTVSLGLKLNTSQVFAEKAVDASNNNAKTGIGVFLIGPRGVTGYTQAGWGVTAEGQNLTITHFGPGTSPTAAVTSVTVTGFVGDALVTLKVSHLHVYALPTTARNV